MHSFLCLPAREALMCKMRLNCCLRSISLGMAGIVACVAFPVQADGVSVPTPPPGQTSSASVNWVLSGPSENNDLTDSKSIQLVARYLGAGVNHVSPDGTRFRAPFPTSNSTLSMGFYAGNSVGSGIGNVLITLPALDCNISNARFKRRISTELFESDLMALTSQMYITQDSLGPYDWSSIGLSGLEVRSGIQSVHDLELPANLTTVTTSLTGNGQSTVKVGAGAKPGKYSITLPVQCESYHAATSGGAMQSLYLVNGTATVSVEVTPRPHSCFVQPPPPVTFSPGLVTKSKVQLDMRGIDIKSSCDVSLGSPDINKGMYLTFAAGSYGLYNSDVKKLGTSLGGYYITGGTDGPGGINPVATCSNSNMQFDGVPHPEFRLKTLEADDPLPVVNTHLYFSLCRDTSKPLVTGELHSDAKVNVVVQ